jgi:hypothetical protein
MIRFNAAALPLFAGLAIWKSMSRRCVKNLAIALGFPLLIVLPWLIRNEIVFHGEVLYSTQGGPNAVQGFLTSEGRTQPGDSETLRKNLGWELHQIETNDSSRLLLPSEAALDRRAIAIVHVDGDVFVFGGSDFDKLGAYAFNGDRLLYGGSVFVDGTFPAEFLDR